MRIKTVLITSISILLMAIWKWSNFDKIFANPDQNILTPAKTQMTNHGT